MRIIAGKFKGRRLELVRDAIRPTSDRLRESLFAVLGRAVEDSVWLDAFAGSGAVGLEALSRGARLVIFNDKSRNALALVRANLERCGAQEGFRIIQGDVFTTLRRLRETEFSFIFLDPPYDFGRYRKLLKKVIEFPGYIPGQSLIILEVFKKTRLDFVPESLEVVRTLRAGDSILILLRAGRTPEEP